jgi:hypothetical protein
MAMIEVRFSLEKETKGALGPHQEVDDKGEVRENRHPVHCKSVFERDAVFPQKLRVTVETGSAPNAALSAYFRLFHPRACDCSHRHDSDCLTRSGENGTRRMNAT